MMIMIKFVICFVFWINKFIKKKEFTFEIYFCVYLLLFFLIKIVVIFKSFFSINTKYIVFTKKESFTKYTYELFFKYLIT